MNKWISEHFAVLDQLENKWAQDEPRIASPYENDGKSGPAAAISRSTNMETDIVELCRSAKVLPAYLLSISCEGTVGGSPVAEPRRFVHFCGQNPLLLATIDRVCERVLDADRRRALVAELGRLEFDLSSNRDLNEEQRVIALRESLHRATGGLSAVKLVAREVLGTKGEPPPAMPCDFRLTRLLADALRAPYPMGTIARNFISDALMQYRAHRDVDPDVDPDMDPRAEREARSAREAQHRAAIGARVSSMFCARFNGDLPSLTVFAQRLERQSDLAKRRYKDHVRASGTRSIVAVNAGREAGMISMARKAANEALTYLTNAEREASA